MKKLREDIFSVNPPQAAEITEIFATGETGICTCCVVQTSM
jgi:hypothetical protein